MFNDRSINAGKISVQTFYIEATEKLNKSKDKTHSSTQQDPLILTKINIYMYMNDNAISVLEEKKTHSTFTSCYTEKKYTKY